MDIKQNSYNTNKQVQRRNSPWNTVINISKILKKNHIEDYKKNMNPSPREATNQVFSVLKSLLNELVHQLSATLRFVGHGWNEAWLFTKISQSFWSVLKPHYPGVLLSVLLSKLFLPRSHPNCSSCCTSGIQWPLHPKVLNS